jgi:hypothetical protein
MNVKSGINQDFLYFLDYSHFLLLHNGAKSFQVTKLQGFPYPVTSKERERVRKDSIRVEEKRKHLGESERRFMSEEEKEHLVRRYPGNAPSSF